MSRNASFIRKVIYIAAIALLLIPLSALSQPSTISSKGVSPGGKLSQLRNEYNLSQANLGEIDPASETMKLATLGLRGVAANILWSQANHYKKYKDWDNLEATVQQIIRLQPNFLEVWDFQAHNLSYNVSVEFDDYRFRYEWVKKGIDFLILGTEYNRDEPGLLYSIGWFTGQKIGRADEAKQFRRLFRDDKDFHDVFRRSGVEVDQEESLGPDGKPDNWLVGRLWYLRGVDSVTYTGKPIRGKSPLLFYSGAPMSQINGSAAMQKDGFFHERAQISWQRASDEWSRYGNREIPTSAGFNIRLNELESIQQRISDLNAQIDELAPGIRQKLRDERMAALTDEERAAVGKALSAKTVEEYQLSLSADSKVHVTNAEIARNAEPSARPRIRELDEQIGNEHQFAHYTQIYRGIVNFEYWRTRCAAEKTDVAQTAHAELFEAERLRETGEQFSQAKQKYEAAFKAWGEIFAEYPALMDNAEAQDLIDAIENYNDLLGQIEEDFPADFPLDKLLDRHDSGRQLKEQVRLISGSPSAAPKEEETQPKASEPAASDSPASTDEPKTPVSSEDAAPSEGDSKSASEGEDDKADAPPPAKTEVEGDKEKE
jgi:hypothetical protein